MHEAEARGRSGPVPVWMTVPSLMNNRNKAIKISAGEQPPGSAI